MRPGVGKPERLGLAAGVALDGHEARDPATALVGAPHEVARALGGHHDDVDALGRVDEAVSGC